MIARPNVPKRNTFPRLHRIAHHARHPVHWGRPRRVLPRPVLPQVQGPPQRVPIPDMTPQQEQAHREAKRRGHGANRHVPGTHNQVDPAAKRNLGF